MMALSLDQGHDLCPIELYNKYRAQLVVTNRMQWIGTGSLKLYATKVLKVNNFVKACNGVGLQGKLSTANSGTLQQTYCLKVHPPCCCCVNRSCTVAYGLLN